MPVPDSVVELAEALLYARKHYMDGRTTVAQILYRVIADIEEKGLDVLDPRLVGNLARFRRLVIGMLLSWTMILHFLWCPSSGPHFSTLRTVKKHRTRLTQGAEL